MFRRNRLWNFLAQSHDKKARIFGLARNHQCLDHRSNTLKLKKKFIFWSRKTPIPIPSLLPFHINFSGRAAIIQNKKLVMTKKREKFCCGNTSMLVKSKSKVRHFLSCCVDFTHNLRLLFFFSNTASHQQAKRLIKQSRHISTAIHPISRKALYDITNRIITCRIRKLLGHPSYPNLFLI